MQERHALKGRLKRQAAGDDLARSNRLVQALAAGALGLLLGRRGKSSDVILRRVD